MASPGGVSLPKSYGGADQRMTYRSTKSRIVEIKDGYKAGTGDKAVATEVLGVTDDLLSLLSTLPEAEARRTLALVRDLLDVVEENLRQQPDSASGHP